MYHERRNGATGKRQGELRGVYMNKRGQALVEFVIILPVFIFMLLGIIDVGKVIVAKTQMESQLSDALDLYRNHKSYEEISNELKKQDDSLQFEMKEEKEKTLKFIIQKDIDIVTPGLGLVLGNPCKVEAERVVHYEP